jgi:hypothetical protein
MPEETQIAPCAEVQAQVAACLAEKVSIDFSYLEK